MKHQGDSESAECARVRFLQVYNLTVDETDPYSPLEDNAGNAFDAGFFEREAHTSPKNSTGYGVSPEPSGGLIMSRSSFRT